MVAKRETVAVTVAAAGPLSGQNVIFTRPEPRQEFSEENRTLYLASGSGYRVYFSSSEMDQIFQQAVTRMEDDLETVVYMHPNHAPQVVAELKTELRRRHVELAYAGLFERPCRQAGIQVFG